jgi:hypothetical protein
MENAAYAHIFLVFRFSFGFSGFYVGSHSTQLPTLPYLIRERELN